MISKSHVIFQYIKDRHWEPQQLVDDTDGPLVLKVDSVFLLFLQNPKLLKFLSLFLKFSLMK